MKYANIPRTRPREKEKAESSKQNNNGHFSRNIFFLRCVDFLFIGTIACAVRQCIKIVEDYYDYGSLLLLSHVK